MPRTDSSRRADLDTFTMQQMRKENEQPDADPKRTGAENKMHTNPQKRSTLGTWERSIARHWDEIGWLGQRIFKCNETFSNGTMHFLRHLFLEVGRVAFLKTSRGAAVLSTHTTREQKKSKHLSKARQGSRPVRKDKSWITFGVGNEAPVSSSFAVYLPQKQTQNWPKEPRDDDAAKPVSKVY